MMMTRHPIAVLLSCLLAAFARAADLDVRVEGEFKKLFPADAKVERLAEGMKFTEGPVWLPSAKHLVFSDIPSNELKKFTRTGGLSTYRSPSDNANGNAVDGDGRLLSCEHSSRRVTRTEADGKVTVLADRYEGKALNSPNDLVVRADGIIFFTDPDYGLPRGATKEQAGNYVYRLDPASGSVHAIVKDFDKPNGVALSPDGKKLYVADSGRPRHIRVFDLSDDGMTAANGKVFCTIDVGGPDGIKADADGRIWSSAEDGVQVFGTDGTLLGKVLTPEIANPANPNGPKAREGAANLGFGDEDGKTLYITARTSLYAIRTSVTWAGAAAKR
jgi:gluconolactonase